MVGWFISGLLLTVGLFRPAVTIYPGWSDHKWTAPMCPIQCVSICILSDHLWSIVSHLTSPLYMQINMASANAVVIYPVGRALHSSNTVCCKIKEERFLCLNNKAGEFSMQQNQQNSDYAYLYVSSQANEVHQNVWSYILCFLYDFYKI